MKYTFYSVAILAAFCSCSILKSPPERSISSVKMDNFVERVRQERSFLSYQQTNNVVEIQTSSFPVRLEFLREDVVKLRFGNENSFRAEYTWSIDEALKWETRPEVRVSNEDARLVIKTKSVQVIIDKNPFVLSVLNTQGEVLLQNSLSIVDKVVDSVNRKEGGPIQNRLVIGSQFTMTPDDHFYGLGQKVRGPNDQSLDWRGRRRDYDLNLSHMGNRLAGADGAANGNMMVPFLLNTKGYGLFLDTAYKTYWEFDSADQKSWYVKQDCDQDWETGTPRCERSEMRYYIMVSDQMPKILDAYTKVTGKPLMPPRWMLGYLQSNYGYRNWNEVHAAATGLRADGFPLDGIFLDLQWFGGVPGANDAGGNNLQSYNDCAHRRIGSLKWFKNKEFDFSSPRENLERLNKMGVKVVPIEEGYFDVCNNGKNADNNNFNEAESLGFLARKDFDSNSAALYADGNEKTDHLFGSIGYFGQVGMIDTSTAAAREWFWSKHLPILHDGAATFWTDLGEPERFQWWWKYANGLYHQDIHNVWDLNRSRAFYEGFTKDLPDVRPFILSRSGYAGSQRFGVGIWSGDAPSHLYWAAALPSAHLNLAISGIPYTTSDIGGFGGPNSTPQQFTRWLQMETFSSMTRSHGNTTTGENVTRVVHPHQFPEPFKSINRKYIQWRESLIPYIYNHARLAFETGFPIVRALPLMWPKDLNATDNGSEFMLGESILVAPVLTGEDGHPHAGRNVYLPPGEWIDMHDGQKYAGGQTIGYAAPIERMPLFARNGSIIPKGPSVLSVNDPEWDATRIFEVFPTTEKIRFELYDDDGLTNQYRKSGFAKTTITSRIVGSRLALNISAKVGSYSGMSASRTYGFDIHLENAPRSVLFAGKILPHKWNGQTKKLTFSLPPLLVSKPQNITVRL